MFGSLLASAVLFFTPQDATNALERAVAFVNGYTPRDAGTSGALIAAYHLLDAASAAGANARLDRFVASTPDGKRNFANVMAELPGEADAPWVVLVSHYDTKPGKNCPGANDGASTSALLLSLCEALNRNRRHRLNYLLIWTDAEECRGAFYSDGDGFQGSQRAAAVLKQRKLDVCAVLVLDMLGDADLNITIPANVTPKLRELIMRAAAETDFPKQKIDCGTMLVKDDHLAFLAAGFPSAVLIDFAYGSAPGRNDYWHTPADTPDKLSAASLLQAGRLVTAIIERL